MSQQHLGPSDNRIRIVQVNIWEKILDQWRELYRNKFCRSSNTRAYNEWSFQFSQKFKAQQSLGGPSKVCHNFHNFLSSFLGEAKPHNTKKYFWNISVPHHAQKQCLLIFVGRIVRNFDGNDEKKKKTKLTWSLLLAA